MLACLPVAPMTAPLQEVSILVPNAGLALGVEAVHQLRMEDVRTMLDTNVLSVVAFTRAFTPAMVQRNAGHLIFMSRCASGGCALVCVYECVLQGAGLCLQPCLAWQPVSRHGYVDLVAWIL